MKKNILISAIALILIALLLWLFWPQTGITPETPISELPFGSAEDGDISFSPIPEGEVSPLATSGGDGVEGEEEREKLFKLSSDPVAGFVAITRATSTRVRFVDRATGHVYETTFPGSEKVRLTNNTIPKIYEAIFRDDGGDVLLRYLKDDSDIIENLSLNLGSTTSATLLTSNLSSPVAGRGNVLYYFDLSSKAVYSSSFSNSNLRQLYSSPFKSWEISRLGTGLLLSTKASSYATGYSYRLGTNGALTRLLGPLSGLVVVASPSGGSLLYSHYDGSNHLLSLNLSNNISGEILPTTLAEKCVWSPTLTTTFYCGAPRGGITSREPDMWYQGKTHFSDYIWSFNTTSESGSLILDPEDTYGVSIDVVNPSISPDGKYLVFINKSDLTLWAVSLESEVPVER